MPPKRMTTQPVEPAAPKVELDAPALPPRKRKAAAPTLPAVASASPPEEPSIAPKPAPAKTRVSRLIEQRARQARRASVMLKFVSDPTRLQVVLFLAAAEHHVGALCDQLGQTQPAVSHHLALLRHGGIISPRRLGKNNFYSLTPAGGELAKVVRTLMQNA